MRLNLSGSITPVKAGMIFSVDKNMALGLLFVLVAGLIMPAIGAAAVEGETEYHRQTLAVFRSLPGLTDEKERSGRELIKKLKYDNSRMFRRFCRVPATTADHALLVLEIIARPGFNYDQTQAFETICQQADITIAAALTGLDGIKKLNYVSCHAFMTFCRISADMASTLSALDSISKLTSAAAWAAQAFFKIPDQSSEQALNGLEVLQEFAGNRAWAAEAFFKLPDLNTAAAFKGLAIIARLRENSAWAARSLFQLPQMETKKALVWLHHYFLKDGAGQEELFFGLSDKDKRLILTAYKNGRDYLIRKINNLHSITDPIGAEIQVVYLYELPLAGLLKKFDSFSAETTRQVEGRLKKLTQKKDKSGLIKLLYKATALERAQVARALHSAEIYVLLVHGSELYDSSFRDILVPELKKRLETKYGDSLLRFFRVVDPESVFVTDFIVNIAQRGKFSDFIPADRATQQQVINLMTFAAFQKEENLVLFSATFMKILRVVGPETRSHIIDKMLAAIAGGSETFAKKLTVILQYYLKESAGLLAAADRARITTAVQEGGVDNFERFFQTPFASWKEDGNLRSLSIFHADDDGEYTFLSFCWRLWQSGYKLRLSPAFCFYQPASSEIEIHQETEKDLTGFVNGFTGAGPNDFYGLFVLLKRYCLPVDFVKVVNGLTITQSVYLYKNFEFQKKVLELFIRGQYEMLAQRGHSYWRREQLIDPLQTIIEEGVISSDDLTGLPRFISIGSCGGMNSYRQLNDFFGNKVDILATIGTGIRDINNLYNQKLFEIVAENQADITWKDVVRQTAPIFGREHGHDYIQPGSLPAILQKM